MKTTTKRTIEVEKETAQRIQIAKQIMGLSTADETINKVFDIAEGMETYNE
jgi:hypothetical protein